MKATDSGKDEICVKTFKIALLNRNDNVRLKRSTANNTKMSATILKTKLSDNCEILPMAC